MATDATEPIERWTAKRRVALVVSILLEQVTVDIQRFMEDAEDVDRFGTLDDVGNAIMAVEQDADVLVWIPLRAEP